MASDILATIEAGASTQIRVTKGEYKGRELIDVRKYYLDDNDEWRPTQKGIALSPEQFDDVLDVLIKLKEEGKVGF